MSLHVAGLDLGQAHDFSALTVVEATGTTYTRAIDRVDGELGLPMTPELVTIEGAPCSFRVRHLERFELGTAYPAVVARVVEVVRRVPAPALLAVDATGVGRPVVDLLEREGLAPVAITITGGDSVQGEGRSLRVPKRDLVGVLQVGLQNGRLLVAAGLPLASLLLQELLNFKVKITAAANDTYGAWREGQHDDLVLAVAVACWAADQAYAADAASREAALEGAELAAQIGRVSISPF